MPGIINRRLAGSDAETVNVAPAPFDDVDDEPVPELEPLPPVEPLVEDDDPVELRVRDCCFFSSATRALMSSFDDSSTNPNRIVELVESLSFGATRLNRARPRGPVASFRVTPPKFVGS
jgi:hypothetical protein